ncbi:MAG: hypothetical protein DMF63_17620 [Acidobacteria bacterium]|nr:MAG: hypothetical protein DMF63_17620 [Acidobacteriota bacterium]
MAKFLGPLTQPKTGVLQRMNRQGHGKIHWSANAAEDRRRPTNESASSIVVDFFEDLLTKTRHE